VVCRVSQDRRGLNQEGSMRIREGSLAVILVALSAVLPPGAMCQEARDLIQAAIDRYEERMSAVENYTIVQEVMGFESTAYYEKRMVDGRPVFKLIDTYGDDSADDMGEMYAGFMEVANRARYSGQEKVAGYDTHVLTVDDFSGLALQDEDDDFKPKKGVFYLDANDYIIRRIVMDGVVERNGEEQPATADMFFEDYRTVEGMVHPFLINMSVSGATSGLSEEELEQARKDLEEVRKQMEEMPESQRKMMESMMGPQIEKLEQMVESGGIELSITVKELRVNQGPPN
jgi:hypothetical protein